MKLTRFVACVVCVIGEISASQGKRFGEGFQYSTVLEMHEFPDEITFLNYHMKQKIPLVIRGGAKISPAFNKWSDEYFLSLKMPENTNVHVETMKKEDRKQATKSMHFQEFVRVYNGSGLYMVDEVPKILQHDIAIPCPLRSVIFVESVMWYSSGGTKSVVHTDSVDNLNCLYRGYKDFILIDSKDANKVDMDESGSAHSSVDVDNVDYAKFPGLATVDYYNVSLEAGDCLYIPYLWIHQVSSYGHNIAVNLWWEHYLTINLNVTQNSQNYGSSCSQNFSLLNVEMTSFNGLIASPDIMKDRIIAVIGVKDHATWERFKKDIFQLEDLPNVEVRSKVLGIVQNIFTRLDMNSDGKLEISEVNKFDNWTYIVNEAQAMDNILKEQEALESNENDDVNENGDSDDLNNVSDNKDSNPDPEGSGENGREDVPYKDEL